MNLNIILVGSNPLPCYIQAAYVLRKERKVESEEERYLPVPDEILFVATEATKEFAQNIQSLLLQHDLDGIFYSCRISFCSLKNGRDATEIENRIKEKLDGLLEKKEHHHILLNDTGGTKVMTTHAALLCRDYAEEHSVRAVECYVDPDKNCLRCLCLNDGNTEIYPKTGQIILQDQVRMSIQELIGLHYGKAAVIENRNDEVEKEDFETNIQKLCGTDSESFIQIAERILGQFDLYKEFYKIWNGGEKKSEKQQKFKSRQDLKELFIDINGGSVLEPLPKTKVLNFWGRGEWLELYFYLALRPVKQKLEAQGRHFELVWSCKVKKEQGSKEFEVDIVTVRGFVLTLYSLTMAESGETRLAKGKWFEAVYRTDQMGGGHGKTELVCLLSDRDEVNRLDDFIRDLERSDADRSIQIKTIEDLKSHKSLTEFLMGSIQ